MSRLLLPAEWEPTEAVMVSWPHTDTDWAYMLDDIRRCYADIVTAISKHAHCIIIGPEAPDLSLLGTDACTQNINWVEIPTNDTWIRDYGPISVYDNNGCLCHIDYKFNGWGLKFAADKDNLVTSSLIERGILPGQRIGRLSFVLEGGSIESDGRDTLLTTSHCLLSPNRNGDTPRNEIEARLRADLGSSHILWLNHGRLDGDDTDGHVDTLARLLPGNTIAYTGAGVENDDMHAELSLMAEELKSMRTADGKPFRLIELPLPSPVFDPDDGHRLPATYANFLLLNDAILLPVYGQADNDKAAEHALADALPGYKIIPVNCSALLRQHGSLHCATMQIPVSKKK